MDRPSPQREPEAYVPRAGDAGDAWWPPASRADAVERARRARMAEGGLPVDEATLERVADAVLDPAYELPGLFYTPEEAADEIPDEVFAALDEYMRHHPGIDGGRRVGWRDGRATVFVGIAGDVTTHADAVRQLSGGRAVVEPRGRSAEDLEALANRIVEADAELHRAGFEPLVIAADPAEGVVEVQLVGGADEATARAAMAERFGPAVRVRWLGPSSLREAPQPFGAWMAEGRRLRVFFGLDHNGEQFHSVTAEELAGRIVVTVTKLEPVGPASLIGGFQALHADVELSAPVGDRQVVDACTGEVRPSLAELRSRAEASD